MHLSMSVRTAVNYARPRLVEHGHARQRDRSAWISLPVRSAWPRSWRIPRKYSMISFFQLVAFISINLGVMNLLPLPALDGGRLVFLIIEGIRRKPVPPRYEGLCARGRNSCCCLC